MEITQFISTLLEATKKVAVPGLGTFAAAGAGEKDDSSFFPFLSKLSFSEKHDAKDRKLVEEIAESRGITAPLAGYEVDKFVIRVKQELSRNGAYEFKDIGRLKTVSGKIEFESFRNDRALFGLSPVEPQVIEHENMVETISRKIGLKDVGRSKFKLLWIILIGLIGLALIFLLLVRLNVIG